MPGPEEIRPEHFMAATEDPLQLGRALQAGRISIDQARQKQWKIDQFRAGNLRGRWDSPLIEEYFNNMLAYRQKLWHERTDEMFAKHYEHERTLRPGQQVTNLELVTMEFGYIDRMLLQTYIDCFVLASERADVASYRGDLARELRDLESDMRGKGK